MTDVQEFMAILRDRIGRESARDGQLRAALRRIESGKATFRDTALWSERASAILGEVYGRAIPDIPADVRRRLTESLLREQYETANAILERVQRELDAKQGLSLRPQRAEFPAERVRQLGESLTDRTVPEETVQRRARSGTANVSKSFHDAYMKENAKFRSNAGLKCWIMRDGGAKCCEWCAEIAGKYAYGDEPQDVYRRHDNCSCTVTFENGRQRQDVWSRAHMEAPASDAGAPEPVRLTREQAAQREAEHPVMRFTPRQAARMQNFALTNGANRATMMLNDSGTPLYPVTQESLAFIPRVTAFPDERVNRAVEEQCRAILEAVQNDEIGTECTVSIRLSDLHSEMQKGGQGEGTVVPIGMEQPFISIHNHASNETISPRDARMLALWEDCTAVVVIGNKGDKLYILEKTDEFDADGLLNAIKEKIKPENARISDEHFLSGSEIYGTRYFG